MTAIAALLHPRGVVVGADTCITLPNQLARDSSKIARRGYAIVGAAGDGRLCELALSVPCREYRRGDLGNWLRCCLVPALWAAAKAKPTDDLAVVVLAATSREIAIVDSGGAIALPLVPEYAAIGSGAEYILGALSATRDGAVPARRRLDDALTIAAAYAPGVAAPWTWLECRR